jgi:Xaa-Pro dipeptidase
MLPEPMALPDRQRRARDLLRGAGHDALLATDPGTIWWLTGFAVDLETGPSPFAPPPVALLSEDEPVRLVVSDDEAPAIPGTGVELVTYEGFTVDRIRGRELAHGLVAELIAGRRLATDDGTGSPGDLRQALLAARAIKDADEIEALRAALRAADAGQRRLREAAVAGATEIEIFGAVRQAIEREAGARTPVLADLLSGERTADIGGSPTARTLADRDLVLCDLAPRVGGVWADSCATVVVGGEATHEQRRVHARVREALDRAIDVARPGIRAADLHEAIRGDLGYPHHSGHGLGGSFHEEPRIVAGSETVLAPGMVIAIEPAHYTERFGLRLEHVLLVTEDGAEDLSHHALEL